MRRIGCWVFCVFLGCTGNSGGPGGAPQGGALTTGGATTAVALTGGAGGTFGGGTPAGGMMSAGGAAGDTGVTTGGRTSVRGGAAGAGSTASGGRNTATGGAVATGGASSEGGASSGSDASSQGGAASAGGASSRGGTLSTGGVGSQGGATSTGGTSPQGGTTSAATPLDSYVRSQGPITLSGVSNNASGLTWKAETDTFFVVANTVHELYEYSADFKTRLRTISLDNGPTDTEDVFYLGSNRFAVVVEDNEVYVLSIPDGATSANMGAADVERYVVSAPPATANRGFEGVTFRPDVGAAGQFIVCQEGGVSGTPIRVLFFERRSNAGTSSYANGTLTVDEPWNASSKLGAAATDLAAVCFDPTSSTLLVLSQESSRLLRVYPETGDILDQRTLSGSPQYEGLTFADGGRLVLVSEPNYVEVYTSK